VDELLFNEGFSRVRIQAGRMPGDPVSTSVLPANGYPRLAIGAWTGDTLAAAGGRSLTIAADGDRPGFAVLTGTIRPADTTTLEVAHRNPSAAFLAAFEQALRERGILVVTAAPGAIGRPATSTVSTASAAAPPGTVAPAPPTDTLFALLSPPLREIMPALEKPSQNQIAEALYKTLGLERLGVGTADSGRVVVERQLRAWGIDTTGFVIRDGSGLSRHDYLSPETVVRVLDVVRQAPYFRVFYDALPIAGVDGTIANRMRGTAAQANVRAKTGYIDRARSLSGYVTTADGHLLVFSFLANNWTVPVKGVERVQDTVAAQLARMRLGGPPGPAIGGR
jgi:D-alanyl-D-alanine carboxypeptidase/D-alanyl-D-alanine-endopeptidase (penicillin-binding protein 4)